MNCVRSYFGTLFFVIIGGSTVFLLNTVMGQHQQYFRVQPKDKEVIQGETAEMQCHIAYAAGAVQWSKDGFVLGYDPEIPGYPRYGMVVDRLRGVYNLRITNVQLQDEGEYECQVGPALNNRRIWEKANLTVLVPPQKVEIQHRTNANILEVREAERVPLTCFARLSKPQAKLKWFKNGIELKENAMFKKKDIQNSLFTTSITTTLYPKLDDNNATYECQAIHPAIKRPKFSSVTVIVLFPPEPPKIEGYREDDIVQVGDTLTLACISRGGNPPPKLLWFRNGALVDSTYSGSGRETTNPYTFHVDSSDNNAEYRCEASNTITLKPTGATVKLKVYFPPTQVTIKGPKEGKRGDNVTLSCVAGPSNPAAKLSWIVDGRPVISPEVSTETSDGGWITTSRILIRLAWQEIKKISLSCYAINEAIGNSVSQTTLLNIIYPPGHPSIQDFQNKPIRAGDFQRFTCVSYGGNPVATLRWFKGEAEVGGTAQAIPKGISHILDIRADSSDNGAVYRCEASNPATLRPLATYVTPTVLFAPSSIKIEVEPKHTKAGQTVVLTCESTSSNPEASVKWWKNGNPITGSHDGVIDGQYGGKITKSRLRFNVTSSDDNAEFKCQATNLDLHRSVHDTLTLRVLYKPEFLVPEMERFDAVEGESEAFNVTAKGNPPVIDYTWIRDGEPVLDVSDSYVWKTKQFTSHRVVSRGPVLEIAEMSRNFGGQYVCEASNSQGTTRKVILINVLYQASITKISPSTYAKQGDDAQFLCEVTGNPLTQDIIRWNRPGYEMRNTQIISERGRSFLTVLNVSKEDAGNIECVAYNGIGEESIAQVRLVVKFQPVIQESQYNLNIAGEEGRTVRLICRAEAAPNVSFTWSKDGDSLSREEFVKMRFSQQDLSLGETLWESTLFVNSLNVNDFGIYECTAKNEMGRDEIRINLRKRDRPDPPNDLSVKNVTHNSVSLIWAPGFDGGYQQQFRIRFRTVSSSEYAYSSYLPGNASKAVINVLNPETEYIFEIMSRNIIGKSGYSEQIAHARTLDAALIDSTGAVIDSSLGNKGEIPRLLLVVGSVVGALLVFMNAILVICFIRKRKRRQQQQQENSIKERRSENSDNKMYTPSTYKDKINGEALCPVDDKRKSCHDIMMKELAARKKINDNGDMKPQHKMREPKCHLTQDYTIRTTTGSGDDCPDILKTRRTHKIEWPRSSVDDSFAADEELVVISPDSRYSPFPVTPVDVGKHHVRITETPPIVDYRTRHFHAQSPQLSSRSFVGSVGTHVV
ncbi:nephrin-like [Limulus polyphemus]|uniref:Nephrin-like n=1 Tax=Limulus polyphemus TaxID=6850 RepID=A0ABM1S845_LIMPO|nr:nephrin-like [Limulus polyphemus]